MLSGLYDITERQIHCQKQFAGQTQKGHPKTTFKMSIGLCLLSRPALASRIGGLFWGGRYVSAGMALSAPTSRDSLRLWPRWKYRSLPNRAISKAPP